MRRTILCAAAAAVAIVVADHAVAVHAGAPAPTAWSVDRAGKGDLVSRPRTVPAMARDARKPPTGAREAQKPSGREVPDGCETGISPLAKGASGAPPALCVTDAGPLTNLRWG